MTEKKYMQTFLSGYWKYWVGLAIIGLIAGYVVTAQMKPSYEGAVSFVVTKNDTPQAPNNAFYTYAGYYADQASVQARNNLSTWLKSPRIVSDIYDQAHVGLSPKSAASLQTTFKTTDTITSNSLDLTYTAGSQSDAEQLGNAIVSTVKSSYKEPEAVVTATQPVVVAVTPSKELVVLGSMIAFAALGFLITLLIHYFRSENA